MKFVISRAGQQQGPYSMESLPELLRNGSVVPTDLIYVEGWPTWIFVSDYLKGPASAPAAKPPPLPSQQPPPIPVGAQRAASARGASATPPPLGGNSELERAVLEGGRYVFYQYCFSVLVMTFKRPSQIVFLRGDEDGFSHAFSNSLISLTAGWWGFPWGPIWTIASVIKNAQGGTDVTQAVLEEKLGPDRASQILARRKPPSPRGKAMTCFRWGLVAAPVLLLLLITVLPYTLYLADRTAGRKPVPARRQPQPSASSPAASPSQQTQSGEELFRAANRQINVHHDAVAFGNSPKAIAAAQSFSKTMQLLRENLFEGGKKTGFSASDHQFLTYCELHESRCAFIVHVPELRRFNAESKKSLGDLAWVTAQNALKEQGANRPGLELAVGLRGIALYDRVLLGTVPTGADDKANGLIETVTGVSPEERLHLFFLNPAKPSTTASQ